VKFCQKYGIISNFAKNIKLFVNFSQIYGITPSFAENMELCEVLLKIWDYAKFCRKYRII
jgi:hypothetical protein